MNLIPPNNIHFQRKIWAKSGTRIFVERGGTRSGKSFSAYLHAIIWLLTGEYSLSLTVTKGVWSFVRDTGPALKASVWRDTLEILEESGLIDLVDIKIQDKEIRHKHSARMIDMFSVDDEQKVRSRKRDFLTLEEGNEIEHKKFRQLFLRTKHIAHILFNPDDPNIWINTELEQKRKHDKGDVEVIVSNYKHNPHLPPQMVEEIEYLEKSDPEAWGVFGLGEYGKIAGLLIPEFNIIDEFPKNFEFQAFYGLDFGFDHPQALVKAAIQDRNIYVDEMYYKRKTNPDDFINFLKGLKVRSSVEIYGDSARPESIAHIKSHGFYGCQPARKGSGSVKEGIDLLRTFKFYVTSRSVNLIRERRTYKWKIDKSSGEPIVGVVNKVNDDCLDALRYAVYSHYNAPAGIQVYTGYKKR